MILNFFVTWTKQIVILLLWLFCSAEHWVACALNVFSHLYLHYHSYSWWETYCNNYYIMTNSVCNNRDRQYIKYFILHITNVQNDILDIQAKATFHSDSNTYMKSWLYSYTAMVTIQCSMKLVNPCTWARLSMSLFIAKQLYIAPALYFVNHNVIILDILWLMLH